MVVRYGAATHSFINAIENGRRDPTISTVARLAIALGCPVADLLPVDLRGTEYPDGPLLSFMAELSSYAGILTSEQWIAVRSRARELFEEKSNPSSNRELR
jgi:transcriptional regulator with XRE-family HTH domain